MTTSTAAALCALLVCTPAWAMSPLRQASPTRAAVELVGDGSGSDARNTTSVYDGGKAKFNPNRENGGHGYQKRKTATSAQPARGPQTPEGSPVSR